MDYDQGLTAEHYREAKEHPWRSRVEAYSFLKRIGDVSGESVVDLACGEGHYTRMLRRQGAARILGCDISERMIGLAREREANERLGIEYRVEDAGWIVPTPEFDLAVAAWLLAYARNRDELLSMCRGVAGRLRTGGRFVTITTNPGLYDFRPVPDYRKYGFEVSLADYDEDGAPIDFTIHLSDSSLRIENHYLPITAYESAFRDAGLVDLAIHRLELAPNAEGVDDRAWWADLLDHPVAIVMEAVKS